MSAMEKPCSKCGKTLPLEMFVRNRDGRQGRLSVCKSCTHTLYYLPNREKVLSRSRERRAAQGGREREREWQSAYRQRNRLRRLVMEAKGRARRKGIAFDIQESDLTIPSVCPVLGIPIVVTAIARADGSPSLDRIDPKGGYVRGNVIVISWRANRIKSDASVEELERIVSFYREGVKR